MFTLSVKKENFIAFIMSIGLFIISFIIQPYYIYGDQYYYNKVYQNINHNILYSYILFKEYIGGSEPLSFLIYYINANIGIKKLLMDAVLNSLLSFFVVKTLRLLKVSYIIILVLLCTNFYMYMLYFSAYRLKVGILFFMIGLYYYLKNKQRTSKIFFILSVFGHFQMFIIMFASLISNIIVKFLMLQKFKTKFKTKSLLIMIFWIVTIFLIVCFFQKYFFYKINYYYHHADKSIWKLLLLYLFTFFYMQKLKFSIQITIKISIIFLLLLLISLIIGSERINMFGYFIFFFIAVQYKQGFNMGIIFTSIYFMIKNIFFVNNIIIYGNGFYK
jgi:hypothetical protein